MSSLYDEHRQLSRLRVDVTPTLEPDGRTQLYARGHIVVTRPGVSGDLSLVGLEKILTGIDITDMLPESWMRHRAARDVSAKELASADINDVLRQMFYGLGNMIGSFPDPLGMFTLTNDTARKILSEARGTTLIEALNRPMWTQVRA